jgi:hypothetical protein
MVAISLMLLLGVAAFAIDLAAIRLDRASDKRVSDAAAAAGALAVALGDGVDGCETALAYVELNTPGMSTLSTSGCAAYSAGCNPTSGNEYSQVSGRFTVTFVYPVPDGHALMTPGELGSSGRAVDAADGDACERVGVEIASIANTTFARVLGFSQGPTSVHTVATASLPSGASTPLNLLVLDRFGCQALDTQGNGGIVVDAVVNPNGGGPGVATIEPGIAAADSDGTGTGCSADGVIDVDGSGSVLRADGPAGCSNQTGTALFPPTTLFKGFGCGLIRTLASGTPGCAPTVNMPACSPGAGGANRPNPDPTALPDRLTRAPVDYRYNCQADYSTLNPALSWATDALTVANEQDIPACSGTPAPNIHNLIAFVGSSGQPSGFSRWTASGYPCDVPSSNPPITVSGNWWIDCPTFNVRALVRINGSAVFNGGVNVTSAAGHLNIQNTLGGPGYAFFRNGTLTKDGSAHLTFQYTTVYLSKTSRVALSGGAGSLTWVAPNLSTYQFDDLALWSDSPATHNWAGQAALSMEGVFFTPLATADYSGTAGQNQTAAQFISDKLVARGSGQLVIRPVEGRAVEFPTIPHTTLIR